MRRRGPAPQRLTRRARPGPRLLLRRHRRLLAALCLAAASGLAVDAATAAPPPGVAVPAAARDLPSGHRLGGGDLVEVRLPREAVPAGVLPIERLVGDVLAAPVRDGEVVTDVRVLTAATSGLGPGQLALPVRLGEQGAVRWLRPGQRVSVLAVPLDPAGVPTAEQAADVVARDVVVLDVGGGGQGGSLLDATTGDTGAVVLLAVTESQARSVAATSAGGLVTVALLP